MAKPKTFTLEQAHTLLPVLKSLLKRAMDGKKIIEQIEKEFQDLKHRILLSEVKDLDMGLLDFPCKMDDQIVLLCWKYGEDKIEYWHSQEEGFPGRKPIDERILRGKKKEKPN